MFLPKRMNAPGCKRRNVAALAASRTGPGTPVINNCPSEDIPAVRRHLFGESTAARLSRRKHCASPSGCSNLRPMKPSPIPADYPQVCASISTRNTAEALEFYQKAFGAKVRMCMKEPGGKVAHAEILIGTGMV